MKSSVQALIIQNPSAGRRRARRSRAVNAARHILREGGVETDAVITESRSHATELARNAAGKYDLVIVCGGDGTINEAVNGLAHSETPLAILPAGTANILAKELRIPWDIPAAAALIPSSVRRRVALGAVDIAASRAAPASVRYFMCVAGAGPDGALVRNVSDSLKFRFGTLAYWYEGMRQLALYRFPEFFVNTNGHSRRARLLVVGRTRSYGGPFRITTRASLFEDSFEMMAVNSKNPFRYLAWLPPLFLEHLRHDSRVHYWKTPEAFCDPLPGRDVYAQVDGEPIGALPMRFRVAPAALTLCIPSHTPLE